MNNNFSAEECPGSFQSRITKNQKQPVCSRSGAKERITMRKITIKTNEFGEYQAYYPVGGIELPIGTPFPVRKISLAMEFWRASGYRVNVQSVAVLN